jgi:hypothetical protein
MCPPESRRPARNAGLRYLLVDTTEWCNNERGSFAVHFEWSRTDFSGYIHPYALEDGDMGRTRGPYRAEFPVGTKVRIASPDVLKSFMRTWKYHHPLQPQQLEFAGRIGEVKKVYFYHGGDELYELEDMPGVWHEVCLETPQ